jgi:hypothetical protein
MKSPTLTRVSLLFIQIPSLIFNLKSINFLIMAAVL